VLIVTQAASLKSVRSMPEGLLRSKRKPESRTAFSCTAMRKDQAALTASKGSVNVDFFMSDGWFLILVGFGSQAEHSK
jgi:hypothetical protein